MRSFPCFAFQFEDFAQEIISVSNDVLSTVVTSMDAMSSTMIAFAKSHQAEWPLYTLPEYELFGDNLRNMSGAQIISWSPIVKGEEDRQLWETYTAEQAGGSSQVISSKIFRRTAGGPIVEETGHGPFSPVWQMSSASSDASTINFNLLSDPVFHHAFVRATGTQGAVLSEVVDATKLFGAAAMTEVENPQSLLVTPVYNGFSSETGLPVLVGSVVAVLPWNLFFKDIIHDGIPTIYAVVNDGLCGNEFSYQINGPEALYLGQGKFSESDLDKHSTAMSFAGALMSYGREDGVDCAYTVTFYPVQELKDQLLSLSPVIWTIIITAVFVFTTAVFGMYDYIVQARQRRVLNSAAKSNAIVSVRVSLLSLFNAFACFYCH
jgi:hypothetical protein